MNIQNQFNRIAGQYDGNRRKFIPCFDDFYAGTTRFIASNINPPERVIDLGAGTGLLTSFWYRQFPESEYILVDIADDMLKVARERFENIGSVSCQTGNYREELPDVSFDTVISALSIHHLEHQEKAGLFARIYERLPDGGLFVNYDQFCAGPPEMNLWFDRYWEGRIAESGLTDSDMKLWSERRKLDRECSVEQQTEQLRNCSFRTVSCVYACQKFAVIAAVK